jgi:hypothetical protein
MECIMAANTLKGAANRAWIVLDGGWDYVTRAQYDTLKFFADKTLFDDLLLRLSGDKGRRIYLTVGTGERQVFLSEQPGVAASRARDRAELAQIRAAAAKAVVDAIVEAAKAKVVADSATATNEDSAMVETTKAKGNVTDPTATATNEDSAKPATIEDVMDTSNNGKKDWTTEVPNADDFK